jgi:hypothetical protein
VRELDKLMASLELLDEICHVNRNIYFLNNKMENLSKIVEQTIKEKLTACNLAYIPSVIEPMKKQLYSNVRDEISKRIASLEEDKENLRNEIKFIQSYQSADFQEND